MTTNTIVGGDYRERPAAPARRWRRYLAYRALTVPWLPDLPSHWHCSRLKHIAAINSESLAEVTDEDYVIEYVDISNVNENVEVLGGQTLRFGDAPSRARRKVRCGDTIISTVRTYLKAIAFFRDPAENLVVSTGFAVLRPQLVMVTPEFLWLLVQSASFVDGAVSNSNGVAYPAIAPGILGCLPVWIPPAAEQRAITAFLDRETARIDALIAKKERLIALLEEKRAALISHAVTKGLDLAVPMKSSELEWLGTIPAHWQIARLRFVAGLQTGVTLGKDYGSQPTGLRAYLRVANVQDGYLNLGDIAHVALPAEVAQRCELQRGDVLMTEGGDFDKLGRGHVWEGQIDGCLHQNHIFSVRPATDRLNPYFLSTLIASLHGKAYFTSTSQQTTNLACTNSTKLRSFPVLLPPLREQETILDRLGDETTKLDALTTKIREQIDKLQERRVALISAAVTGQIDVRGEAA